MNYTEHCTSVAEWSSEDKNLLLLALNKYGPTQVEEIANAIPFKTISDVRVMIHRYERLANYDPNDKYDPNSAIDKWTEIMRKHTTYNELVPVSRALKYIALFEKREEGEINLSDCYELLSNMSEGIAPRTLDAATITFLKDTLTKLALHVKNADNHDRVEFLRDMRLNQSSTKTYGSKKNDDTSINPLRIPKALNKPN